MRFSLRKVATSGLQTQDRGTHLKRPGTDLKRDGTNHFNLKTLNGGGS